jgi:DNA polymerase III subunit epsilon
MVYALNCSRQAASIYRQDLEEEETLMTPTPRKRKHQLEWEEQHYRCTVCQWTWKRRPRLACPGVPCYRVDDLPEYLLSEPQLFRRHLRPAGPPDACYFRWKEPHWLWLFDVRKATPIERPTLPRFNVIARLKAWWESGPTWCQWCGWRPENEDDGKQLIEASCEACRYERQWLIERKGVCRWAQMLMNTDDWVLLATATTGLHGWAEVIELAVLRFTGEVLLHSLVRPQSLMDPEVTTIHGLTNAALQTAPTFPEIWPDLTRLFKRRHAVIAYEATFHQRVLADTAEQYHLHLPDLNWFCLLRQYACYWGQPYRDGDYRWKKLDEACQQLQVPRGRSRKKRARLQAQKALGLLKALAAQADPSPSQKRAYALFGVR